MMRVVRHVMVYLGVVLCSITVGLVPAGIVDPTLLDYLILMGPIGAILIAFGLLLQKLEL